jgi:hypothetical protein
VLQEATLPRAVRLSMRFIDPRFPKYSSRHSIVLFLTASHAFIMIVSWFVVLTGGALLGRYGRDWPQARAIYFKYHQNIQLGGYIAACVGVLIQFFFAPVHFAVCVHLISFCYMKTVFF